MMFHRHMQFLVVFVFLVGCQPPPEIQDSTTPTTAAPPTAAAEMSLEISEISPQDQDVSTTKSS